MVHKSQQCSTWNKSQSEAREGDLIHTKKTDGKLSRLFSFSYAHSALRLTISALFHVEQSSIGVVQKFKKGVLPDGRKPIHGSAFVLCGIRNGAEGFTLHFRIAEF